MPLAAWIAAVAALCNAGLVIGLVTLPKERREALEDPLVAATGVTAFLAIVFLFAAASPQ
jgi:hypothetical protein